MNMCIPVRFSATLCVVACVMGSATSGFAVPKPGAKVGASAVWQLPEQFIAGAHAACDKSAPSGLAECFIDQMTKAGASADAVSFTRELYKQSQGEVGIMTGLQPVGPVDIAWITYPLRANTNYGLLFINGDPPIVNVENLNLLDQKTMKQSPQFKDLKFQFPKVDVWPGDRDGKTWPNSQTVAERGNTVCGGLSADQRMSCLRPCRLRLVHLELHGAREVSRHHIRGHDAAAPAITVRDCGADTLVRRF